MTAATADRKLAYRESGQTPYAVKASTAIVAGVIVCVDATGYAVNGATATGLKAVGMSLEAVDNSAGSSGDKTVVVDHGKLYALENSGTDPVDITDIGATVYIEDNQTIASTDGTGSRSAAGVLKALIDGVPYVQIG